MLENTPKSLIKDHKNGEDDDDRIKIPPSFRSIIIISRFPPFFLLFFYAKKITIRIMMMIMISFSASRFLSFFDIMIIITIFLCTQEWTKRIFRDRRKKEVRRGGWGKEDSSPLRDKGKRWWWWWRWCDVEFSLHVFMSCKLIRFSGKGSFPKTKKREDVLMTWRIFINDDDTLRSLSLSPYKIHWLLYRFDHPVCLIT